MYSLSSPKALTQFFYQRLCLSFFSDVGEQLSVETHTYFTASEQTFQIAKLCHDLGITSMDKCNTWKKTCPTHFIIVLKSSELMPLSGSDRRLMMSGRRL